MIHHRLAAVGCALVVLLTATAGVGAAQAGPVQSSSVDVQGSPDLDAFLPDNEVSPGTETTITVQLTNNGKASRGLPANRDIVTTARGATATLKASGAPISVVTATQAVGSITESQATTAEFDVVIPDSARTGTYELPVEVDYTYVKKAQNLPGFRPTQSTVSTTTTESIRLQITDDARFDVTEVDSKLFVGEEGRITGRLRNVGGNIAENAEVKFTPSNENINALSSTVAIGDISAGNSVPFSIPVEVTSGAEAVPHRFDLNVSYRDENGISQSSNDPEFLAEIRGDRDAFLVKPANNTIQAGGSRTLDVRVTNNLNQTVTNIEGKFFADDPLDSTNDETFTESLAPSETTTVTVDLSAAGGATIKNYPASIDFRYVDSEGDSKLTDSYQVAVTVTESETSGGPPIGLFIGLLVVLAAAGYLSWRRGVFSRLGYWN